MFFPRMTLSAFVGLCCISPFCANRVWAVDDASPLAEKAAYLEQDLIDKHSLDGLYVSIVPSAPHGTKLNHTVNEPGNVIHSGVWTGRYLAGVGYQYAVTRDPRVRDHGGQILRALRILQEVTGKPGLLARGYVKGHGPVVDWERDGANSREWHQGQGAFADYRWHGDVSVDNFNAVLYGYAIYFDLAADEAQKQFIAQDVDRLMTHLLDNHCRIIDVDGEPTEWGHVGMDPDPSRDDYYVKFYAARFRFLGVQGVGKAPLRASLMLLPDLLIANHITGKQHYLDFYRRVIDRYKNNPEPEFFHRPFSSERLDRVNHSSEGQSYEALFNLVRYEHDPELLKIYRSWVTQLWEYNWMEGNSLFAYMTLSLLPEHHDPEHPGAPAKLRSEVSRAEEGLRLANESLAKYPIDRVMKPVMNSLRTNIEFHKSSDRQGQRQAAKPLPINERPLDNEYAWKSNPYQLDGWLKPGVVAMQFASDDPQVAWFCDTTGRVYQTLDRGTTWNNVSNGLRGASVRNLTASKNRTLVLWADTDQGIFITRDGGLSWRAAPADDKPVFSVSKFTEWNLLNDRIQMRIDDTGRLVRSTDGGKSGAPAMRGWRIPVAKYFLRIPWGIVAGGPGGAYRSDDGESWTEWKLWREEETGAADFLHAYWMGRYYGFVAGDNAAAK